MISPSMGERCQFENWGRPLGGTDFRLYAAGGKAPITIHYSLHAESIPHLTQYLFRISRIFYYPSHATHVTHLTQLNEIRI